jgi:hypothetical protein
VVDLIAATTSVYGMGVDLAVILAAYGLVFDGIGLGWSIGGVPHTGISGRFVAISIPFRYMEF